MAGTVRLEKDGNLGWIFFDQPERRNAISADMWRAIPEIAAEIESDRSLRAVVMRGAGDVAFVSGADISEFGKSRSGVGATSYDDSNARAFAALATLRVPLIAMVHGFCVGGGCAISLTADLRYCADDAVFAIPAARLGLGYSPPGLEALVNVVGLPAAKELFFTARRFDANEALQMGLVNRVFPKAELEAEVRKSAELIADNAPLTLRAAKLALSEIAKESSQRNMESVGQAIRECYESADYVEGVRAFLEKRRPRFQGS